MLMAFLLLKALAALGFRRRIGALWSRVLHVSPKVCLLPAWTFQQKGRPRNGLPVVLRISQRHIFFSKTIPSPPLPHRFPFHFLGIRARAFHGRGFSDLFFGRRRGILVDRGTVHFFQDLPRLAA